MKACSYKKESNDDKQTFLFSNNAEVYFPGEGRIAVWLFQLSKLNYKIIYNNPDANRDFGVKIKRLAIRFITGSAIFL
jgi:hypothetical protein